MFDHPVEKRHHHPQDEHEDREHIVECTLIVLGEGVVEPRQKRKSISHFNHQHQNEDDLDLVLFIEDHGGEVADDDRGVGQNTYIEVVIADGDDHGTHHQQVGVRPRGDRHHQSQNEKQFEVGEIPNRNQITNSDSYTVGNHQLNNQSTKRKLKLLSA